MQLPYGYMPVVPQPYGFARPFLPVYRTVSPVVTGRPPLWPVRARELLLPVHPGMGWGYGAYAIEPGLLFFAHGNPIGGPSQAYRGVSASRFPVLADVLGPGAPMADGGIGIAGAPI